MVTAKLIINGVEKRYTRKEGKWIDENGKEANRLDFMKASISNEISAAECNRKNLPDDPRIARIYSIVITKLQEAELWLNSIDNPINSYRIDE
jgi:hypothetical protein